MTSEPLVSVILPVYNAQKYLDESLKSILRQTYKNLEIIVIDDCSTDKTPSIISSYLKKDRRVIYLKNKKNLKLSKTLNRGIIKAQGKYILRMDADDWSFPERVQLQVDFMESNPDVGIVGGFMKIMNQDGVVVSKREYKLTDKEIRKRIYLYSPFSHPTIMIRKAILDQIGMYKDKYNPAEDYDLYFRIGEKSKFANLDKFLIKYRIIPGSMTTGSMRAMEKKTIKIRFNNFKNPFYKPSILDILYTYFEYLSLFLVPDQFKLWLFKRIRDQKINSGKKI